MHRKKPQGKNHQEFQNTMLRYKIKMLNLENDLLELIGQQHKHQEWARKLELTIGIAMMVIP